MAANKRTYTVPRMSLGERIQERMEAQGLSQTELARRVGVSQPAIYALINNNKTGSRRLPEIARELHTTPAYLTGETDDPESNEPAVSLSADEREWVEWLRAIAPKDRKAMLQLARTLAGGGSLSGRVHDKRHTYEPAE